MAIEQLAKVIVEESAKSEQKKTMFKDSNRNFGMELLDVQNIDGSEITETEFYPDSERECTEGPQWDETKFDEKNDASDIEETLESLNESENIGAEKKVSTNEEETKELDDTNEEKDDPGEKKGLTDEQKQELKEKTGWSDEIISSIGSMEEAEIYMDASLQEVEIDGKKCVIKDDIDMNQTDEDGISNRERMERGRPPLTKDGHEVELHHIGQKQDSPLAELTTQEHRGVGNDTILHDKNKQSEIDRNEFAKERKNHWKFRVKEGEVQNVKNH